MVNELTFTTNTKKGAERGSRHLEPVLYGDAVPTLAATIRQTTPAFTADGEHNEFYLNRYTVLMYMFFILLVAMAYAPTKVVYDGALPIAKLIYTYSYSFYIYTYYFILLYTSIYN
jgi:hypothetical protein